MEDTKYQSAWYSSRGFANEGCYVYGTESEMDKFSDTLDLTQSKWLMVKTHNTLHGASMRCVSHANKDNAESPDHEYCDIGCAHIAEFITYNNREN